uniref:Chemokine interleukin-8-like domain-containing protein n=1 Tax=Junco hyemalis TaxID=40217 RepID=A0A8C5ILS4_JUNHY
CQQKPPSCASCENSEPLHCFFFPGEVVPRSAIELRCQCISTHSKFIHPKFIQNVNLTPSGPHCKNVEVIATLRNGREVCLEPSAPWVKLIIK